MFEPLVKGKRNYELVIDQLQKLISKGELKFGNQLPSERQLAEKLNVSRTSIREALRVLEALNIVQVKSGEGTFLQRPDIGSMVSLIIMFLQEDDENRNLFETRILLESGLARSAAIKRTDEDLAKIEKYCQQIIEGTNIKEVIQADYNFHDSIIKSANNQTLYSFYTLITELMKQGIEKTREMLFDKPRENEISAAQHVEIYQAIRDKNPEAAYQAMYHHLEYTSQKTIILQKQKQ